MTQADDVDNILLGTYLAYSTTTSRTASKLVDTGVNFTTLGVAVGDKIKNVRTGSETTVSAVDSATILSVASDIMHSGDKYYLYAAANDVVIVYTEHVEEIYVKALTPISPPQSSANWASGPKDTKIVDLLRLTIKLSVKGSIDTSDITAMKDIIKAGGVFGCRYDGEDYDVNTDKFVFTKSTKFGEQDERQVQFTALKGVDV